MNDPRTGEQLKGPGHGWIDFIPTPSFYSTSDGFRGFGGKRAVALGAYTTHSLTQYFAKIAQSEKGPGRI